MQPVVCLLIDDDSEESEIFQYAIEELKFPIECHLATSGKDALDFLTKGLSRPDFIFLDLNMPKMDGSQCLQAIRNIDTRQEITIILYSTFFHEDQKKNLQNIGANGFITKTTSILELNSELARLFKTRVDIAPEEKTTLLGSLITPSFEVPKLGLANN